MKRKKLFISTILSTFAIISLASCDLKQKQTGVTKTTVTDTTTDVVTTTGIIPTTTTTPTTNTGVTIPTTNTGVTTPTTNTGVTTPTTNTGVTAPTTNTGVTTPTTTTGVTTPTTNTGVTTPTTNTGVTTPTSITTTTETTTYEKGTYYNPYTVSEALEIARQLSMGEQTQGLYYISGKVVSDPTTDFCNFYLGDDDNQLYSYGLYTEDGSKAYGSRKQISSIPISTGDEILVYAYLKNYNGQLEMVNAMLQSIKTSGEPKTLTFNTEFNTGNYDSNFGSLNFSNYSFGYYRAYGRDYSDNYFLKIYDNCSLKTDASLDSIAGAFYNMSAIYGMDTLSVNYVSESDVLLYLGKTQDFTNLITLPASDGSESVNINISNTLETCNYFSFETTDSDVFFKALTIDYSNQMTDTSYEKETVSSTRISPTRYTGTLEPGVSKVSVPVEINVVNDKYTVIKYKEYTYMTFEYLDQYVTNFNDYAYTDPVDVINYYNAFGVPPVNYGAGSNVNDYTFGVALGSKSEVNSKFGALARLVSCYDRTDGYVRTLPYNTDLEYYEFDIALDSGYSTTSRGVGRIVTFKNGLNGEGYSTDPVSFLTEDHYVTFKEFSNAGYFNDPFDSVTNSYISFRLGIGYSLAVTYTLA